jgi:hypothetical protein
VHEQRLVGALRGAATQLGHALQQKRRERPAAIALGVGFGDGAFDRGVDLAGRCVRFGHWDDDQHAKTLTVVTKGTDALGMAYSSTQVFDRQP